MRQTIFTLSAAALLLAGCAQSGIPCAQQKNPGLCREQARLMHSAEGAFAGAGLGAIGAKIFGGNAAAGAAIGGAAGAVAGAAAPVYHHHAEPVRRAAYHPRAEHHVVHHAIEHRAPAPAAAPYKIAAVQKPAKTEHKAQQSGGQESVSTPRPPAPSPTVAPTPASPVQTASTSSGSGSTATTTSGGQSTQDQIPAWLQQ